MALLFLDFEIKTCCLKIPKKSDQPYLNQKIINADPSNFDCEKSDSIFNIFPHQVSVSRLLTEPRYRILRPYHPQHLQEWVYTNDTP